MYSLHSRCQRNTVNQRRRRNYAGIATVTGHSSIRGWLSGRASVEERDCDFHILTPHQKADRVKRMQPWHHAGGIVGNAR